MSTEPDHLRTKRPTNNSFHQEILNVPVQPGRAARGAVLARHHWVASGSLSSAIRINDGLNARQSDRKTHSVRVTIGYGNPSMHASDGALDEHQFEIVPRLLCVNSFEPFEDAVPMFRRNADAIIVNREHNMSRFPVRLNHHDGVSLWGPVFEGIRNQVLKHHLQGRAASAKCHHSPVLVSALPI